MAENILLHNVNLNLDPRGSYTQNDAQHIATDEIRARDGDGLKLYDDGGLGMFVKDGGGVTLSNTLSQQSTAAFESGALSAELLASAGWTSDGWTGADPTFTHTAGNVTALSNTFPAVVGILYQIAYTVTGRTAGTVAIALGGQSITINATGAFGPKATTTDNFIVTPTADFDGTITLSVKSITAYAATYNILDNTGVSTIEIRSSLNTLSNTFLGQSAGQSNTTGHRNTFIGQSAGQSNTTGYYNTFIGLSAGQSNTTGHRNTFIGQSAGQYQADGTTALESAQNSIYLGCNAKGYNKSDDNSIVIGFNAVGIGANTVVLGNDSITTTALKGDVGIETNAPTAKLDVNSDILRLRTAKTPASAGAAGNTGDSCWDADYEYRCVATNSWTRAAHAAW